MALTELRYVTNPDITNSVGSISNPLMYLMQTDKFRFVNVKKNYPWKVGCNLTTECAGHTSALYNTTAHLLVLNCLPHQEFASTRSTCSRPMNSFPIDVSCTSILSFRETEVAYRMFSIINTFHGKVWSALAVTLIVCVSIVSTSRKRRASFGGILWVFLFHLTGQPIKIRVLSRMSTLMLGIWIWIGFSFLNLYRCYCHASCVTTRNSYLETFQDIIDRPYLRIIPFDAWVFRLRVRKDGDQLLEQLGKRLDEKFVAETIRERNGALERFKEGGSVVIGERRNIIIRLMEEEDRRMHLHLSGRYFSSHIVFSLGEETPSDIVEFVNYRIIRYRETHQLDPVARIFDKVAGRFLKSSEEVEIDFRVTSLNDFVATLTLLSSGIALSFTIFILEIVWHRQCY